MAQTGHTVSINLKCIHRTWDKDAPTFPSLSEKGRSKNNDRAFEKQSPAVKGVSFLRPRWFPRVKDSNFQFP